LQVRSGLLQQLRSEQLWQVSVFRHDCVLAYFWVKYNDLQRGFNPRAARQR
jgi:hypothetical protein